MVSSLLPLYNNSMINQTTIQLLPDIRKYGCLYLSMSLMSPVIFTPDDLNKIWTTCIQKGYITGDVNGNGSTDDPEDLCILKAHYNDILKELKAPYKFKAEYTSLPNHGFIIAKYVNKGFTHFVVVDQNGDIIYDPTPNSNAVRFGKVEHYKVFAHV